MWDVDEYLAEAQDPIRGYRGRDHLGMAVDPRSDRAGDCRPNRVLAVNYHSGLQ
jgi:hypothetical protein